MEREEIVRIEVAGLVVRDRPALMKTSESDSYPNPTPHHD